MAIFRAIIIDSIANRPLPNDPTLPIDGTTYPLFLDEGTGDLYETHGEQWVKTGQLAIGGGGSSTPAPGASFETFVQIPDANAEVVLPLDTSGPASQHYLNGLTLNNTLDGLVVGTKGRYLVTVSSPITQHPTLWNRVMIRAKNAPFDGSMVGPSQVSIPPVSATGGSALDYTVSYTSFVELDVGTVIQFLASQTITAGASPINVNDAYCQMQYIGQATSI